MATRAAHKRVGRQPRSNDSANSPAHARIQDHLGQPAAVHCRAPVGIQYPRVALYPDGTAGNTVPQWPVLGHADLPGRLSLCAAGDSHAHTVGTLPALDPAVSEH